MVNNCGYHKGINITAGNKSNLKSDFKEPNLDHAEVLNFLGHKGDSGAK